MIELVGETNTIALFGLLGGLVLGLAARIGRFCTLGALEDYLYSSDDRRLRMWALAIGTAIIATQTAIFLEIFDAQQTAYLSRAWSPLATIIGGLMFGYGMALSGNCGYGALARMGGGDFRSFVIVVVMGLSAYIVMSGPLAWLRITLFPVTESGEKSQSFAELIRSSGAHLSLLFSLCVGLLLFVVALWSQKFRHSPSYIFWGIAVGGAIASGWIASQWVAENGFMAVPLQTHTFAEPIGETILYSMTASGRDLSFSTGSVVGVVIGAFMGSFFKDEFRWEVCDDARELRRQILGAAMMGAGAILAVGCSVGQGISAFSLLAYSAPVTLIAIFVGATVGLRHLIEGT